MRIEQGVAWVDLPDGEFRTATPGECAARIAELEAALREIADGYKADEDGRPQAFRFSRIARKAL